MKKKVISALAVTAIVSGACTAAASADTYTVQNGDSLSVIAQKYHTSIIDLKNFNSLSSDLIRINQVLQLPNTGTQTAAPTTTAYYTVVKGDTLSQIAVIHGIALSDLKQWNNLTSDLIFPGQQLKTAPGTQPSAPAAVAAAPAAATQPAAASTDAYVIKGGDTLSGIARQFSTTVNQLKQLNGLSSDLIFAGQTLKVSGTAPAATVAAAPAAATQPAAASTNAYVIKSGDTLSGIARQFSTTVNQLKQLNGLSSDLIFAGQTLKVSGTAPAVVSTPTTVISTPAASPAPVPAANNSSASTYTVQSGDTLSKIAGQFGTTVSQLKQLNGLSSDLIFTGQTLKVSGTAAASTVAATPTTAASDSLPSASTITLLAKSLMGIPYTWGGTSPATGFDCSGFIYYVFNKAGYSIGRYTADGYANRSYEVTNPQPGDLVFFKDTYITGISHVGIYLGGSQFIQADDNKGISLADLNNPYYKAHFDSFKRFY